MSDAAREEQRRRAVPDQARIDELAGYFDQTDTDNPETWGEAEDAIVERPELEQISLRLPKEDLETIRRRAAKAGIGYTTLIRMILRAHLNDPAIRGK